MVSRATLALRHQTFTETTKLIGKNYTMKTSKPSAAFTAFLKLQREYRQLVAPSRKGATQLVNVSW